MWQNRISGTARAAAAAVALLFGISGVAAGQTSVGNDGGDGAAATQKANPPASPRVYREAAAYRGPKILISTNERRLRLVTGKDTLLDVAVGIGKNENFEYEGKKFRFETPVGRRTVRSKSENPIWTPPEWHYMEKAAARGLELVRLKPEDKVELEDGTYLLTIDGQVGRLNQNGYFWPFTPGTEIIFDGRIYMPPLTSAQRKVPEALGPYKLDMGDGYMIHGTHMYNEDSIGGAVSHGCVRMRNEDLDRLYHLVEPGIAVFIY